MQKANQNFLLEEEMADPEENKRDPGENLGKLPVGTNGAVLFRQRMAQIGQEATSRVRKEMQGLGQKINENKEQGVTGDTRDDDKGARLEEKS